MSNKVLYEVVLIMWSWAANNVQK